MNLLRRRALMIAAQQNTVPVWDGVTVTTPALVDGYYQIYDGATLMGFRKLPADGQCHKARLTADFAINDWKDFETWTATTTGLNRFLSIAYQAAYGEFDGQGHTIYGMYLNNDETDVFFNDTVETFIHNIKFKGFGFFRDIPIKCLTAYNMIFEGNHICNSTLVGLFYSEIALASSIHSIVFKGKSTGINQHGALVGNMNNSQTFKNIGIIGTVTDTDQNYYMGSIIGGNQSVVLQNCWQSATLVKPGSNARALAAPGSTFTNCYCDSTKIATGYRQGTPKTTAEIKSQAFVDLLNANLPAGCTPWKLGTDNYPTLDF